MSIPNEALQKLLQEIEEKAIVSQQQITVTKAQIASKQREKRMTQLTSNELDSLPSDTKVYEGIGKMFVLSPPSDIKKGLTAQNDQIQSDVTNLEKRLHYLETTSKNSRDSLDRLLKSGGKA